MQLSKSSRFSSARTPPPSPAPAVDTVVFMSGPLDSGLSGGDLHALRLCEALAGRGTDRVRLIAPPSVRGKVPPQAAGTLLELRTPLDGRLRSMPVYFAAVTLRMLRSLVVAPASRVSVASTHFFFDVIPCAARRRRGSLAVAYVYHLVADSDRPPGIRHVVSIALERMSLAILRRTGDIVFVDNDETHEALLNRGFRPEQLVMTRNAYDPVEPLPPRSPSASPSVVFCGRLVETKGVWDLLVLAKTLRERVPDARLALLGDGPEREPLETRLRAEGLDNVEIAGFVSEREKWRRLRSASLFVSPSREEGWGIAVGEALLAGVPALVYDLPAYAHFGSLPRRVPVGDVEVFVEHAAELIADAGDLRAEWARVERGTQKLPTWDQVLAEELIMMGSPA